MGQHSWKRHLLFQEVTKVIVQTHGEVVKIIQSSKRFWKRQVFSQWFGVESPKYVLTFINHYSNRPARTHGFNAKISFKKYASGPKILPKKCWKLAFQTKPAKFDTFWPLSLASMHIFHYGPNWRVMCSLNLQIFLDLAWTYYWFKKIWTWTK